MHQEELVGIVQFLARAYSFVPGGFISPHTERVARTSRALAEHLSLSERDASLIYHAAPLHDVGKLAVPAAILLKPGMLTPVEFEQVKIHTTAGAAILSRSSSEAMRMAVEIALTHHEWWDGRGYPARLSGKDIPVTGRIVALADVFDALTHARPYKEAWPVDQAVAEIRGLAAIQFDPQVVEAFLELDPEGLVDLPQTPRAPHADELTAWQGPSLSPFVTAVDA